MNKALTPDDHYDASQCQDFMDRVLCYSSNAVLKYMQGLIIEEINARPQKKCKGEIAMDAFMEEAHEIQDGMAELEKDRLNREPF